jgi:hypothetical protein
MDFGIDDSDPFGVGALFLGQSMAHKFDCVEPVHGLFCDLLAIETPHLPSIPVGDAVAPVDELLDRIELEPALVELVHALLRLGAGTPPTTAVPERLYRSVLWTAMRHDPAATTPEVLQILRDATPGARPRSDRWPPHEFFAAVMVLVYLGGEAARTELTELLEAARDLGHHDLAPILEWYLDHRHSAPARQRS